MTISLASHITDANEGVETYEFTSELPTRQSHCVSRYEGEPWGIAPVAIAVERDMTVEEVRTFGAEIAELVDFVVGLADETPATLQQTNA